MNCCKSTPLKKLLNEINCKLKALIIVDVQNDFLPGGNLAVAEADKIIPVINHIIPVFELVIATQDWHPQNHSSFATNHPGHKPFEEIELNGTKQTLWPDHCVQGTAGAEFPPQLNSNAIEAIFRKGTNFKIDSYSGFYDNNHQKSTGLASYLHGKGVTELFVSGLAGDICVYFTILDALAEGFDTTLITDAAMPLDPKTFTEKIEHIKASGGKVILSNTKSFD